MDIEFETRKQRNELLFVPKLRQPFINGRGFVSIDISRPVTGFITRDFEIATYFLHVEINFERIVARDYKFGKITIIDIYTVVRRDALTYEI